VSVQATEPRAVDPRSLGAPIKGPGAIGVDARRFLNLTRTLALTEFKLRYFGSALGYLWQLMRPLMLFGVIYVIFRFVVTARTNAPFTPVALLSGIVLFLFLSESTNAAVTSIVDRENLVRKVQFPRLVVPLSVVLTALLNLALNLVVVVVFLLASGGSVRLSWLEIPVLVLLLALFATGVSMLVSALYVRYRDIKPVWEVLLQLMFYGTPIFYMIGQLDKYPTVKRILLCNPLADVLQQFRHAVIDPGHPSALAAAGTWWPLAVASTIVIVSVGWGYRYFDREAPRIAEDL
jgi:ABC-2 type transport system permease protein